NRKKELIGKTEQPEYTRTPRGLAKQPETPEANLRRLKLSSTENEVIFRLRVIATNFTKTAFFLKRRKYKYLKLIGSL
ncbi:hypothetical protein A499_04821, partial [Niallia nealsonii AAU1]